MPNAEPHIKLTVLMPVYNAGAYVREAIDSILGQTYRDFEFIIINDGSTDESLNIISSYNDPRIRIINNERNLGIIAARNKALQAARGMYIANMDADDISLPTRFEKQVAYLDAHPDVAILATRLVLVNQQNEETGFWPEDQFCVSREAILQTLPVTNCIGQPTIMMRAEVVRPIGYNVHFPANEDWGLWLHVLSLKHGIAKLPDILLRYRQHGLNTTVTANQLGVEKKTIRFKFHYLKYKLGQLKFAHTDKQVLRSFLRDVLRFGLKSMAPRLYSAAAKFKALDKKRLLDQFITARKTFRQFRASPEAIFVFPFFHTGGAERVHASVIEASGAKQALTLITSRSGNRAFYDLFARHSTVLEVDELIRFGFTERWLLEKLKFLTAGTAPVRVFGCNSAFFYQLLPHLSSRVIAMDLLHAFVHAYEDGPEKWSLPQVQRLNQRITISQKTKQDLAGLYKKNKLSPEYVSRIRVIPNFTEAIPVLPKKENGVLKVAYVGRGGEEKRLNVIAKAAQHVSASGKAIEFHFVGDTRHAVPEELRPYCIFHEEIANDVTLKALYDHLHVIVIASSREGFPMVIMEGMMHGLVPVSTAVGGIPEHIRDGENGLLIDATTEADMVAALEEKINYLYENRDAWQMLSEHAHRYALAHFSKDAFFSAYRRLFTETN